MKKQTIFYLLSALLLVCSCSKDDYPYLGRGMEQHQSALFKKQFEIVKQTLKYYKSNKNLAEYISDQPIGRHDIKWGKTRIILDENGNANLTVPILSNMTEKRRLVFDVRVDNKNKIKNFYFVELEPTVDYYTANKNNMYYENFSGTAAIRNLIERKSNHLLYVAGKRIQTRDLSDTIVNLPDVTITESDWQRLQRLKSLWNSEDSTNTCPLCNDTITNDTTNTGCGNCGYGDGSGSPTQGDPYAHWKMYMQNSANLAVKTINTKYGLNSSQCNRGVIAAFENIYGTCPSDMKTSANEMVRYWQSSSDWTPISMSKAQEYVNHGFFVVAGWINPNGHGHVVVIVPGTAVYDPRWGYLPHTMDTGGNGHWDDNMLNYSFGKDKKEEIQFFYYNK